jgi:glycolate oxidase FAD binding subunit
MTITSLAHPAAPSDSVAGLKPQWVASPASTEEAASVLRSAAADGLAVVPRGSGSRLDWGRPPSRCDLILDLSRMDQVLEHAAGDLVARVQAGARMGHVAEVLAQAGQRISLDVPASATVGGVIADGLAGPLRLRFGTPRDLVIGITVVRADGVIAHSGGRVVKNVAGYDLAKLLAGSRGTLAVITEATFRLHPLPAAREWIVATLPRAPAPALRGSDESSTPLEGQRCDIDALGDLVAAAANSSLLPSAVEIHRPEAGGAVSVGVLIEGTALGVDSRAEAMASLLGDGVRRSEWKMPVTGTAVRVSFWVSALDAVLAAVDGAAAEAGVRPAVGGSAGAGVLDVWFDGDPGAFVAALRARLAGKRGSVTVLTPWDGDVLGDVPGLALMRAVKDQFDPGHVLAPGRIAEGH